MRQNVIHSDVRTACEKLLALQSELRPIEKVSLAAGAGLLAAGLQRRSFAGTAIAAIGGGLVCYGAARLFDKYGRRSTLLTNLGGPWEGQVASGLGTSTRQLPDDIDDVDEAVLESFPASDPPSSCGTTATPCN